MSRSGADNERDDEVMDDDFKEIQSLMLNYVELGEEGRVDGARAAKAVLKKCVETAARSRKFADISKLPEVMMVAKKCVEDNAPEMVASNARNKVELRRRIEALKLTDPDVSDVELTKQKSEELYELARKLKVEWRAKRVILNRKQWRERLKGGEPIASESLDGVLEKACAEDAAQREADDVSCDEQAEQVADMIESESESANGAETAESNGAEVD